MARRPTSRTFVVTALALAVTPALFAASSKRSALLAGGTPSLSFIRTMEPAPALTPLAPPSDLAAERARNLVVIQPLAAPTVTVTVENINTDEKATFSLGYGGEVSPDQAAAVAHFFRCRRTGREKRIAQGTLALLADVGRRFPGKTIEVVSGFRAPPYGVKHSKHFRGQAIDLRVRGVRSATVRDYVWREHHNVGVGYYLHENFVHMDFRPGEPDMAWTSTEEDGPLHYNPRWSVKARRAKRQLAGARMVSSL
jgi:uncharacterized protein YcbK (DUF882 family)